MKESAKYSKGFASKIHVALLGVQANPTGVYTIQAFDTIIHDILNEYNSTIVNSFQPTQAGYYYTHSAIQLQAMALGNACALRFYVNGVPTITQHTRGAYQAIDNVNLSIAGLVYLDTNDFLDVRVWHNFGANRASGGGILHNNFSVFRVG